MPAPQVFISYRRDDAAGYARAIGAELERRFGTGRVFMDVDDIAAGQGFAEVIQRAVGQAQVLLVLIGPRWRGERPGSAPRLFDAGDFVRLEVAAGLGGAGRGLRVIPVLLDGTAMPARADLPADLQPLTERQAVEIGNTRFGADMQRLVDALARTLGPPRVAARRRWLGGAAGAALAALAGAGWFALRRRPDVNGPWQAELRYGWAGVARTERFEFAGQGRELHGSAEFLGLPRGLLDGVVEGGWEGDTLRFDTRSGQIGGPDFLHHYQGRLVGDSIHFVMQTEGGSGANLPVEFVARRAAATAAAVSVPSVQSVPSGASAP